MPPSPSRSVTFRTLDIRPMFARGEEPLEKIIAVVADLGPTEGLVLISPFLPSPLVEKLQAEGFRARPERRADGSWQTHFVRHEARHGR